MLYCLPNADGLLVKIKGQGLEVAQAAKEMDYLSQALAMGVWLGTKSRLCVGAESEIPSLVQ